MRTATTIRAHLTFANVAASLAVVLALGGTAYAAGLPKNSVASKQIKNGSVTTKDVKDGGLRGADLGANSVRGAQVDESGLSTVPKAANAAALGGVPASGYRRNPVTASGPFTAFVFQTVAVSGYGTYRLGCDTGGSSLSDDEPYVGYQHALGTGTRIMSTMEASPATGVDAVVRVDSGPASNGSASIAFRDSHLSFDIFLESADHAKVVHVFGSAYDDTATSACTGVLSAEVLK